MGAVFAEITSLHVTLVLALIHRFKPPLVFCHWPFEGDSAIMTIIFFLYFAVIFGCFRRVSACKRFYIFAGFVCRKLRLSAPKLVTYHQNLIKPPVTFEGDRFNVVVQYFPQLMFVLSFCESSVAFLIWDSLWADCVDPSHMFCVELQQ